MELQYGKARLLLDYGLPPGAADPEAALLNIPGLYEKSPDPILAIIVSHTHSTHYGGLVVKPVLPGINIFMSEIMEDVIRITTKMPRDARRLPGNIRYFRRGHKFNVGPFAITPYLMDHNAAESFAFLVEAGGKRLLYTGDFREHGNRSHAFKQFLAANTGPIDALITEGTQAALDKGPAEQELLAEIEHKVKGNRGPLYFMCAGQDMGLLTSLAALAKNTRRFLLVDGYTALLLERIKFLGQKQGVELKIPSLETEYLRVMRNNATQRVYQMSEYAETFRRMRPMLFGWDWVRTNLPRLIIPVRANAQVWAAEQIPDFNHATLLYSAWEDYNQEEGQLETLQWFRSKGLVEVPMPATGHAYFSTIRKLVENKKPRCIIPINTTEQEKFTSTFGKKVKPLSNAEEFQID
jgi:ribonuclease J